jgi:peptidyl-prolyl cis-trans isomerase SurA
MRQTFLFIFTIAAILSTAVFSNAQTSATIREGDKLDGVIAIVGKYPIFKSQIDAQVELARYQQGLRDLSISDIVKLRKSILESEIDQKVLVVKAEQDSITVSEEEIDERIDEQIKMFERQTGSKENLEKQLGKSVAEIKASPDYRDRAKESILIEKLRMSKFSPSAAVSRHDVEEFYEVYKDSLPEVGAQVELATIVKYVRPRLDQKERSKALAMRIIDSLRNKGGDFAAFAERYSQHSTAKAGGDLGGPYPRGTFLPDFEAAAFALRVGEISNVVETDQGIHIIKLLERKGEEIRVAQILFKPTASKQEEDSVKGFLDSLRTAIINGASFESIAREHSDDGETKNSGGDLGRVRIQELSPEQKSLVETMSVGEISKPAKISLSKNLFGFQIVKFVGKVPSHKPTLEHDYKDLEATAKQWKMMRDFKKFVENSRKEVYIDLKQSN